MSRSTAMAGWILGLALLAATASAAAEQPARVGPRPDSYWQVENVRAGMKGIGRTVMKGTKVESFDVEILGVLRNSSPGRDLILARLSGLGLERTGVIAGMSGSPVYIDNKLLGAVAFAWTFGKEPIAGITPFSQMHGFVESFERRDLEERAKPVKVGLAAPIQIDGKLLDSVTVAQAFDAAPGADEGFWLTPLRMPVAATGFTPHALRLLRERSGHLGLLPVQGGAAPGHIADAQKDAPLEPGSPLAVSLVTGDFELSGIGTVTHVEGRRVYGWGHPFMSLGACDLPLMTGYIHTVYPRQTVSFKMGSPLRTVGVINADVSTGIAGWLDRKPDLLPVSMTVALRDQGPGRTFNIQTVRQRSLVPNLVFTALTNSVDMEGELPDELTADFQARIELHGHAPLLLKDTFSGFSGGRAPQALYSQVAAVLQILAMNSFETLRITRIECDTVIRPGRLTADIDAVELDSETYEPGQSVQATVFLRPYKGERQRVRVTLPLPMDLPEGSYVGTVCDDAQNARLGLRDNPAFASPQSAAQVLELVRHQLGVQRTNLVIRVPLGPTGVSVSGRALPDLPGSLAQVLSSSRRTGVQPISSALVARQSTDWVVQGTDTIKFTVTRDKKAVGGQ